MKYIALVLAANLALAFAFPSLNSPVTISKNGLDVNYKGRYVHLGMDGIQVHPLNGPDVDISTKGTIDVHGKTGVDVHVGMDGVSVIKKSGGLMSNPDEPQKEEPEGGDDEQHEQGEHKEGEEEGDKKGGISSYFG